VTAPDRGKNELVWATIGAARMKRALTTWLILLQQDIIGVRFALNVFIGTTVTWYVLTHIADDENPIWAIASMVAASDPQVKEAVRIFWSRLINVLVGCAVGLIFVSWVERASGSYRLHWP